MTITYVDELSVFDQFVGFVLKELNLYYFNVWCLIKGYTYLHYINLQPKLRGHQVFGGKSFWLFLFQLSFNILHGPFLLIGFNYLEATK